MPELPSDDFDLRDVQTVEQYAAALRQLRHRAARRRGKGKHSYRAIAAGTKIPHSTIGGYLSGGRLAPSDAADLIVHFLGASAAERNAFATARDRVDENLRKNRSSGQSAAANQPAPAAPSDTHPEAPSDEGDLTEPRSDSATEPGTRATPQGRSALKRSLLVSIPSLAALVLIAWLIYLLTGHNDVDPECLDTCVYLHKADSVTLWSAASTRSTPLHEVLNKTRVTMLCWTDTEEVRRPRTNYPSARWFKVTAGAGAGASTGYVPSGTVFNQTKVDHC